MHNKNLNCFDNINVATIIEQYNFREKKVEKGERVKETSILLMA